MCAVACLSAASGLASELGPELQREVQNGGGGGGSFRKTAETIVPFISTSVFPDVQRKSIYVMCIYTLKWSIDQSVQFYLSLSLQKIQMIQMFKVG